MVGDNFPSTPDQRMRLNTQAHFTTGEQIRVPNVSVAQNDKPVPARAGSVKVVVSKKRSAVTVYDRKGDVIFHAPVTSGSEHDSLPIGNWTGTSVLRNPTFNYNP